MPFWSPLPAWLSGSASDRRFPEQDQSIQPGFRLPLRAPHRLTRALTPVHRIATQAAPLIRSALLKTRRRRTIPRKITLLLFLTLLLCRPPAPGVMKAQNGKKDKSSTGTLLPSRTPGKQVTMELSIASTLVRQPLRINQNMAGNDTWPVPRL